MPARGTGSNSAVAWPRRSRPSQTVGMFRRREPPPTPEWRSRFDRARRLVLAQDPPSWVAEQLTGLERALAGADTDRRRLAAATAELDIDGAAEKLKHALRDPNPSPAHADLVAALRRRYESIHELLNREAALAASVERALVDLDLLAARSVDLGGRTDRWRLDDGVRRLADDLTALDLAHRELADL